MMPGGKQGTPSFRERNHWRTHDDFRSHTHISWQHKSQTQSLLMIAKSILSAAESSWWVPSPDPPRKPLRLSLSNKPLIFLPLFKAAEETLGGEARFPSPCPQSIFTT